jgi:hypothetical protein
MNFYHELKVAVLVPAREWIGMDGKWPRMAEIIFFKTQFS